jgi:hypothetical protein
VFVATVIASALVALVAAASGFPKIIGAARTVEEARHLGLPRIGYTAIGSLELAAAAGVLAGLAVAPLGIAAAAGLVVMMAGAVATHARVRDPFAAMAPALVVGIASAATLGLRLLTT